MIRLDATGCLRLAPDGEAVYALGYLDDRFIDGTAEGTWVPGLPYAPTDLITIQVDDRSGGPAATAELAGPMPSPSLEFSHRTPEPAPDSGPARAPGTMLEVGERFTYTFHGEGELLEMEVVSIHHDDFVLAVPVTQLSEISDALYERIERAMEYLHDVATPRFYDPIFGDYGPPYDPENQLVFYFKQRPDWPIDGGGGSASQDVQFQFAPDPSFDVVLQLLAHELAHVWDFWRFTQLAATTSDLPHRQQWSVEGVADLVAYEVTRDQLGIDFFGNIPVGPNCSYEARYWCYAMNLGGHTLSAGYGVGAAMMRDFMTRLIREVDLDYDEALRAVALGAWANWYGCGYGGCGSVGLAERMASLLGPEWSPQDAILQFVLSVAADDVLQSDVYSIPSFYEAGSRDAWEPELTVRAGRSWACVSRSWCGEGWMYLVEGGLWYMKIEDQVGAALEIGADAPGLEWALLRVR